MKRIAAYWPLTSVSIRIPAFLHFISRGGLVGMFFLAFSSGAQVVSAPTSPVVVAEDTDLQQAQHGIETEEKIQNWQPLEERVPAVTRHQFLKQGRLEISLLGGVSVSDAFFRRWGLSLHGVYHFNETFALEAGGLGVLWNERLNTTRLVGASVYEKPDNEQLYAALDVGLRVSPLYGKIALAAELAAHFDMYIYGGGGAILDKGAGFIHPAGVLGVGSQFFINRFLSVHADVRDWIYPQSVAGGSGGGSNTLIVQHSMFVLVGIALYLPLDFAYDAQGGRQ